MSTTGMKKLVFGCLLSAGMLINVNIVSAQNQTPEQRADKKTEKMTKELALDQNQGQQVKAINQDAAKQISAIKADPTLDKAAKKEKIKAIRKESRGKIKALLTPEQKQKVKAHRQQMRAQRKAAGHGRHMGKH